MIQFRKVLVESFRSTGPIAVVRRRLVSLSINTCNLATNVKIFFQTRGGGEYSLGEYLQIIYRFCKKINLKKNSI